MRLLPQQDRRFSGTEQRGSLVPVEASSGMAEMAQSLAWGHNESQLVTELQAGSESAFDWLVTYYHGAVYNLVYGILSDRADAADVTQEVFLRAFKGIRGFRHGSSLKTWLYRISVREALNHRRWFWRHHRNQVSIEADEAGDKPALQIEDGEATPFDHLAAAERQAALQEALSKVPEIFRSAVILRDLEGLSYEEVAEVLDVSVGTVKSRILRGRRALREALDPILNPAPFQHAPSPLQSEGGLRALSNASGISFGREVAFATNRARGGSR